MQQILSVSLFVFYGITDSSINT